MITGINCSLNFKSVYTEKNNYTDRQKTAAEDIIYELSQNTIIEKCKKNRIDFIIKPENDECSVSLYTCKKLDKYGYKNGDSITLHKTDKCKRIGTYTTHTKPFNLKDAEDAMTKKEIPPQLKLFGMLGALAAMIAIPVFTHVRRSSNPYYLNSEYVSLIDTIAKDTIKILPKVK